MDIVISHKSALEYWRQHASIKDAQQSRHRRKKLPDRSPDASCLRANALNGFSLPLNALVSNANARRPSKKMQPHVLSGTVPGYGLISIDNGVYVSSPEFCFLQMATTLPLLELIELGFELCGLFSKSSYVAGDRVRHGDFSGNSAQTVYHSNLDDNPQLTTVKKIRSFVEHMPNVRGRGRALKALRYILDNSASPMEAKLVMLLCLPFRLGGYGFPSPELNSRIDPVKAARSYTNQTYFKCDLFWPHLSLAVEYDSDEFHTGTARIARDSRKRNALASLGILVITVTREQIKSTVQLEAVAKILAAGMNRRLRYKKQVFAKEHRRLHSALIWSRPG
ncbi:MAG: hypothetical protein LBU61_04335 [Coriobacteriales bacterium]|jgi:hypothetical protein|nr:hypothetical protein [Coriobacteriales bacterium]